MDFLVLGGAAVGRVASLSFLCALPPRALPGRDRDTAQAQQWPIILPLELTTREVTFRKPWSNTFPECVGKKSEARRPASRFLLGRNEKGTCLARLVFECFVAGSVPFSRT